MRQRRIDLTIYYAALAAGVLFSLSSTARAEQREFQLVAQRKAVSIGQGLSYNAWTYDGTMPGPLMRVGQGDSVKVNLVNHTADAHGLYPHAAQLNMEQFSGQPGDKELSYTFQALVPGVFDYHCTAIPVLDHIASGMYGMMIVDPKGGWPSGKAHEIMLIQGEIYGTPDTKGLIQPNHPKMVEGTPDFVVFNGKLRKYDKSHPIEIKVGELVRVFYVNVGPNLFADIHVVGALFDTVYRSGNPANAVHDVQSFEVGPGDGAVLEFRVKEPGDYQLMDHSMGHAYKGASAVLHALK